MGARLAAGDVACWLLKTATTAVSWAPGTTHELRRCVRPSYRLGLVRPGRPCLLWRSGRDRPGVHALGVVAAEIEDDAGGPVLPVRLTFLAEPVDRAELLADPAFRDAEVLRMPTGSNPSWLTAAQYAAVLARV
ncbi:hypothetical protein ACI797_06475 [Geodermatophilus sp. SYSU D00691]